MPACRTRAGRVGPGRDPAPCVLLQKWQRRFFVLYEHGLLRYALDEMVSACAALLIPSLRQALPGGGAAWWAPQLCALTQLLLGSPEG